MVKFRLYFRQNDQTMEVSAVSGDFPRRLRELRKRKRLTQAELGALFGVGAVAVHKWETGASEPSMKTLCGLADLFGVSLDMLVGDAVAQPAEMANLAVMTRAFRQLTTAEQEQLLAVGRALYRDAFRLEEGE